MTASTRDGFALIKPGQTYVGKQGFTYGANCGGEIECCRNSRPLYTTNRQR
jgi:hypothetical protein